MTLKTRQVRVTLDSADALPVINCIIRATLTRYETDGLIVVPSMVTGQTDSNGTALLALWPNALGTAGSQYRITASVGAALLLNVLATVPDGDAATEVALESIITAIAPATVDDAQLAVLQAQALVDEATTEADRATAQAAAAVLSAAAAAGSEAGVAADAATATENAGIAVAARDAAQLAEIAAATHDARAALSSLTALNNKIASDASAASALANADLTALDVISTHADAASIGADAASSAANAATATEQAAIATAQAESFAINLAVVATNLVTTQATLAYHIAHT